MQNTEQPVTLLIGRHTRYDMNTGDITPDGITLLDETIKKLFSHNMLPNQILTSPVMRAIQSSAYLALKISKETKAYYNTIPVSHMDHLKETSRLDSSVVNEAILRPITTSAPDSMKVYALMTHQPVATKIIETLMGSSAHPLATGKDYLRPAEFFAIQYPVNSFRDLDPISMVRPPNRDYIRRAFLLSPYQ